MSRPAILRPEADQDVESARDWYERQRAGLGQTFLKHVSEAIDRLKSKPEIHALVWHDVRFCRVSKFPYVVYYRVLSDRVEVPAVLPRWPRSRSLARTSMIS